MTVAVVTGPGTPVAVTVAATALLEVSAARAVLVPAIVPSVHAGITAVPSDPVVTLVDARLPPPPVTESVTDVEGLGLPLMSVTRTFSAPLPLTTVPTVADSPDPPTNCSTDGVPGASTTGAVDTTVPPGARTPLPLSDADTTAVPATTPEVSVAE